MPPVDLKAVASLRSIYEIVECDMSAEGLLVPRAVGFRVELNQNLPEVRKRSTLAHEIGHTFFYDLSSSPPVKKHHWFSHAWSEEGVCSEIGRQLLVPRTMLASCVARTPSEQITIDKLHHLSQAFGASLDIVVRRLQDENLCDAVFIFLCMKRESFLERQLPMFSAGSMRMKGICSFVLGQTAFQQTARRAITQGLTECHLSHPKLGDIITRCEKINSSPIRILSVTTQAM